MKNKYRNEFKILNYITSTNGYRGIFLFSVLLSLYGGFALGSASNNFFDSILTPFYVIMFDIFIFAVILLITFHTCSILKRDFSFYIIRLKNKKEYVKLVLRVTALVYLFHILLIFLFLLIALLLTTFPQLGIYPYENYLVNNLVYMLFFVGRFVLFGLLISMISALIYLNTSDKVVLVADFLFLSGFMFFNDILELKNSITLSFWSYFNQCAFSTFTLEVSSSVLMLLFLEIILFILYRISLKNRRVTIS